MGFQIEDGSGDGFSAKVDFQKRLHTRAVSESAGEAAAAEGADFILRGICHTAAAASGAFLSFTNTGTENDIVVSDIDISSQTITPTDLLVSFVKRPASITGGTDISDSGIINTKFDSGSDISGTLKISDGSADLTYTGGTDLHVFPVDSRERIHHHISGRIIITPNTTFLVGWETEGGGNATDGELAEVKIDVYKRARDQ